MARLDPANAAPAAVRRRVARTAKADFLMGPPDALRTLLTVVRPLRPVRIGERKLDYRKPRASKPFLLPAAPRCAASRLISNVCRGPRASGFPQRGLRPVPKAILMYSSLSDCGVGAGESLWKSRPSCATSEGSS